MEYKQLKDFEEIEANEDGDIRFSLSQYWKPHEKATVSCKRWNDKERNPLSYYIKYQTREKYPQKKVDKSISCMNLIGKLFVENPNNYLYTQAIDGNNGNYKASNIEWVKSRRHKTYAAPHEKLYGFVSCSCGSRVREDGLNKHKLSNKHLKFETV